jgi:hypothetical protein
MSEKVRVFKVAATDPKAMKPIGANELEERARQIGTLAGKAVALLRQAQEKLNDPESWNELRSTAKGRAEEIRHAAALRAQEWQRQARSGYEQARERARGVGRDYPLHVALAAGIVGFAIGAGIRIWRANRGE